MKMKWIIAAALPLMAASCDKETVLPGSDLPEKISTYISTHFPDHKVIQYIKDKDGFELTHDVTISEGIFLEFNRKEEVIEIDAATRLPDSVIPAKILAYVNANYPDQVITDWEIDDKHQQVELDNGLTLEFNMDGEYLRIDS